MPASSKEPTLNRSQARAQPAQQTRGVATQNARMKAKAQPKTRNVGTGSAAASAQRPFTRSLAAAARVQQGAPPTPPKPVSSTPVAPVSLKPESSSTSTTSDTSSSSSGEYSSYDETEDELYPQRKAAISDLHELPTADGACLKELYTDLASDRIINAFLTKSSLYDSEKRVWVDIPQGPHPGTDLGTAVIKIVRSIIQDLGHSKGIRDVIDTRNTKLPHIGDPTQSSKPDMAIKASGPSFSVPFCTSTIGFSNIASIFDVRCDADVRERHADQLAVYNRQIFFHQLNRVFARSLLITETRVRLVHCDRSGGYKTDWVNIHDDPVTLIRLILGLSSPREAVLGLDTSIQWTIKNGRKVAGTITTLDFHRKRVKYQLVMGKPYFVAPSVRGVGTVCWVAKDKAGKHIVIKDSWRVDIQVPEYTFLEKARGKAGVAWMFAYEDGRVQTKTLRPGNFNFDAPDFYNRTMCRVSMECYGAPRQAIAALRDAIQGHWNLLRAGILHRDVSIDNILFGKDGAEEGHRGILIDLEMAASTGGGPNLTGHYGESIRTSGKDERLLLPAAHDYLDDLESFFWILCHLLHGYEGVRRPAPDAFDPGSLLGRFENPQLCEAFRVYMAPIVKAKGSSRFRKNAAIGHTILQDLYHNINHHYTDIISFFDTALEKLVRPGGEAPRREESTSLPPTPAAPVGRTSGSSPSTPVTANLKRPREDVLNAPVKRRRLADA
ncbi:hypothetical protein DFP72DRAFT_881542 [Ephemerocybe angulata]|uniref:Fungal-type protein kinase domain-containing protein n=1 Tax=Ephemerocybe angulata TaxID=980116 RepID=A0A8H6IAD6_9AGAR|nr:hypothetical protein DFP72DRAFT_881542 [Tulosesus angulatus]